MTTWIRRVVARVVPAALAAGGPESMRRLEITFAIVVTLAVVMSLRGVGFVLHGPRGQGVVALGGAVLLVALPLLLRATGSLTLVGNLLSAILFAALLSMTYHRGGVGSLPTMALGFVPIVATFTGGWRSGVAWAAAAVAALVVMAGLGGGLVDHFPPEERLLREVLGAGAAVVVSLVLAVAYESTKNAALQARDRAEAERVRLAHDLETSETEKARVSNEARLLRADRLAALGQLSAGIAHDFNNLLLSITAYSELARAELEDDPDAARRDLDEVLQAGQRAAALTRQLLGFARGETYRVEPVDVAQVVGAMSEMLQRVLPEIIRLETSVEDGVRPVLADRPQLEQLLLNLCLNARDAMPEGGPLAITVENARLRAEAYALLGLVPERPYVRLSVADRGTGMTDEVRARIFEPFFTTKEKTGGTGLGLSIVYGIVLQHQGAIEVSSAPGSGATFHVYLPATQAPVRGREAEPAERAAGAGRRVTVLLAEDDASVRRLVRRLLELQGYEVLVAQDGREALQLFAEHEPRIDVVVVDVVMPELTGRQLHDRIIARRPDMPFLFMSGYSGEVFPPGFFDQPGRAMLSKPFKPDELVPSLHRLLG